MQSDRGINYKAYNSQLNYSAILRRTPGPVPFVTCICSNVETILSLTCYIYGPFESNIPRYFYFAYDVYVSRLTILMPYERKPSEPLNRN